MVDKDIKLSIIIPYYKTYELTVKLLKELSIQVNNNVEIFLIDDCNDTRLDEFKNLVHIIRNDGRKGLSYARNQGIKASVGKYVAFVDSDDMITNDYIDVLLNAIDTRSEDIIYFNWADFNENIIVRHPENYAVWKAIYKKNMVPFFNDDMWYNEDVDFQAKIENIKHTQYYIDRVLYIYNSNRVGSNMWNKARGITE